MPWKECSVIGTPSRFFCSLRACVIDESPSHDGAAVAKKCDRLCQSTLCSFVNRR